MNEVAAIPTAPKAKPTSRAAGTARIAHGETNKPRTRMTPMKPMA